MTSKLAWRHFSQRLGSEGVKWDLFTVLEVDWSGGMVRRSFSSDEANYPSGGIKALMDSEWAAHVIHQSLPFVSRGEKSFRAAFADYEVLESMGLHFALNVPVVEGGRTVRTLNLLRATPVFTDLERMRLEAALAELGRG